MTAPSGKDRTNSWLPAGGGLTYYCFDDWGLSGLLAPGGRTLTLGVAGAAGPWQFARLDPYHMQEGVDLDLGQVIELPPGMTVSQGDALAFLRESAGRRHSYDTIWIDLHDDEGNLVTEALTAASLQALATMLVPGGWCFLHVFRPENRFYRHARGADPFEPLLSGHFAAAGWQASIFDRYASQTWALSPAPQPCLRELLQETGNRLSGPRRDWLDYLLSVLRRAVASAPRTAGAVALSEAHHSPPAPAALRACGLRAVGGAEDWDRLTDEPDRLLEDAPPGSVRERLAWETLAMWSTAPVSLLSTSNLARLRALAAACPSTGWPEFELRRPVFSGME
jgi:hypothetical protein